MQLGTNLARVCGGSVRRVRLWLWMSGPRWLLPHGWPRCLKLQRSAVQLEAAAAAAIFLKAAPISGVFLVPVPEVRP